MVFIQLSSSYVALLSKLVAVLSVQPQILSPPDIPAQSSKGAISTFNELLSSQANHINNDTLKNRINRFIMTILQSRSNKHLKTKNPTNVGLNVILVFYSHSPSVHSVIPAFSA